MTEFFGFASRFLQLVLLIALVGASWIVLVAGRSDRTTVRTWQAHTAAWALRLAALAFIAGFAVLAYQTVYLAGRPQAAVEPATIARVLFETRTGAAWLVRQSLLLLVILFLGARADTQRPSDWFAARGEPAMLTLAALAVAAAASHAAAVDPGAPAAILIHAVHLVATGVWLGGLLPLAGLLRAASRSEGADARPYAVLTARRFSQGALGAVVVLLVTGIANTMLEIGSVAGLLGTRYGHLLLAKLTLVAAVGALAAVNRCRFLPRLGGDADTLGRPAMRTLAQFVAAEAVVGLALLAVVAVMTGTPPGRHSSPQWPLPFRLTLAPLDDSAVLRVQALIGSQLALLGLVALLSAAVLRARRAPTAIGLALLGAGFTLGLPPLTVNAYPTTFQRPAVRYQVTSIVRGGAAYRGNCAGCHGLDGRGLSMAPGVEPPGDLRGPRVAEQTAGDLFWWITMGLRDGRMPAFGQRLAEEQRWDLVNYVRTLAAADAVRGLGAMLQSNGPRVVAPDFNFAVGPVPPRSLRQYRERSLVLLTLYTLPASRPRLEAFARNYSGLTTFGLEIIAVPRAAAADALRQLGSDPPILFPVATEGAVDIVEAYSLLDDSAHVEFLIDRSGYIRSRRTLEGTAAADIGPLLEAVRTVSQEQPVAEPPEHIH